MAAALGSIKDREFKKFCDLPNNKSAVRVCGDASADPIPVTLSTGPSASSPTIYNVVCILANTEYSQAIADGTNQLTLRARGIAKLQVAFASTQSGTNFLTIFPGSVYTVTNINTSSLTIYFQSNKPNTTVEILEWS